jgi:hypothetical protein
MIMAIALYFTVLWGTDALRMLTSPTFGLNDVWRSQFVFEIGRLFALSPIGLIKLAAFFAAIKLTVAGICALHFVQRLRSFVGGKTQSEIFEAGMILVALVCLATIGPALWQHNAELVRIQTIQLLLAGIAAGLSLVERGYERQAGDAPSKDGGSSLSAGKPAMQAVSGLQA